MSFYGQRIYDRIEDLSIIRGQVNGDKTSFTDVDGNIYSAISGQSPLNNSLYVDIKQNTLYLWQSNKFTLLIGADSSIYLTGLDKDNDGKIVLDYQ